VSSVSFLCVCIAIFSDPREFARQHNPHQGFCSKPAGLALRKAREIESTREKGEKKERQKEKIK